MRQSLFFKVSVTAGMEETRELNPKAFAVPSRTDGHRFVDSMESFFARAFLQSQKLKAAPNIQSHRSLNSRFDGCWNAGTSHRFLAPSLPSSIELSGYGSCSQANRKKKNVRYVRADSINHTVQRRCQSGDPKQEGGEKIIGGDRDRPGAAANRSFNVARTRPGPSVR